MPTLKGSEQKLGGGGERRSVLFRPSSRVMAWLDGKQQRGGGQAGLAGVEALGGEGKFDAAGGVALVAGHALQAAVVVQVAGAGCAHTVQLSMGELRAFYVHLDLLCSRRWRGGRLRKEGRKEKLVLLFPPSKSI